MYLSDEFSLRFLIGRNVIEGFDEKSLTGAYIGYVSHECFSIQASEFDKIEFVFTFNLRWNSKSVRITNGSYWLYSIELAGDWEFGSLELW